MFESSVVEHGFFRIISGKIKKIRDFVKMSFGFHAGKLIYRCETNEHHVRIPGVKLCGVMHD